MIRITALALAAAMICSGCAEHGDQEAAPQQLVSDEWLSREVESVKPSAFAQSVFRLYRYAPDAEALVGMGSHEGRAALGFVDPSSELLGVRWTNLEFGGPYGIGPQWSPDGQHVVATCGTTRPEASIVVVSRDGQTVAQKSFPRMALSNAAWSAEGDRIAFLVGPWCWGPPDYREWARKQRQHVSLVVWEWKTDETRTVVLAKRAEEFHRSVGWNHVTGVIATATGHAYTETTIRLVDESTLGVVYEQVTSRDYGSPGLPPQWSPSGRYLLIEPAWAILLDMESEPLALRDVRVQDGILHSAVWAAKRDVLFGMSLTEAPTVGELIEFVKSAGFEAPDTRIQQVWAYDPDERRGTRVEDWRSVIDSSEVKPREIRPYWEAMESWAR